MRLNRLLTSAAALLAASLGARDAAAAPIQYVSGSLFADTSHSPLDTDFFTGNTTSLSHQSLGTDGSFVRSSVSAQIQNNNPATVGGSMHVSWQDNSAQLGAGAGKAEFTYSYANAGVGETITVSYGYADGLTTFADGSSTFEWGVMSIRLGSVTHILHDGLNTFQVADGASENFTIIFEQSYAENATSGGALRSFQVTLADAPEATVPEPATVVLAAIGGAAALGRGARRARG